MMDPAPRHMDCFRKRINRNAYGLQKLCPKISPGWCIGFNQTIVLSYSTLKFKITNRFFINNRTIIFSKYNGLCFYTEIHDLNFDNFILAFLWTMIFYINLIIQLARLICESNHSKGKLCSARHSEQFKTPNIKKLGAFDLEIRILE